MNDPRLSIHSLRLRRTGLCLSTLLGLDCGVVRPEVGVPPREEGLKVALRVLVVIVVVDGPTPQGAQLLQDPEIVAGVRVHLRDARMLSVRCLRAAAEMKRHAAERKKDPPRAESA